MTIKKKIFFLFVFFLLIFGAVEITGLIVSYRFNLNVARFGVPMLVDADNILKDKKLFWKFKPFNTFTSRWESAGEIKINRQGWRDTDFAIDKPAGLKRIALIGDSSTFGYRRKYNEIFANILENKLNELKLSGFDWDVQNYGVPGYTIHQGLVVLNDYALQYKPDYVIIMFGINDSRPVPFNDDEYQSKAQSDNNKLDKYLQKLFSYKIFMSLYFKTLERRLISQNTKPRVSLEKYAEILNQFREITIADNIKFIPMTQPYNQQLTDTPFVRRLKSYNELLRKFCADNSIEYIDIEKIFTDYYNQHKRDFIWDSCHPDAEGNIFISQLIFDLLNK